MLLNCIILVFNRTKAHTLRYVYLNRYDYGVISLVGLYFHTFIKYNNSEITSSDFLNSLDILSCT